MADFTPGLIPGPNDQETADYYAGYAYPVHYSYTFL